MEPMYMNMHSYPHQNGQIHYRPPPRCYPGMEARPPMSYECWPWGSSYGYAPPGVCHGCSNHTYMPPNFAYSHVPPHYYPGNYPHFPVPYMPPPPFNVMEHPRYEYEKNPSMEHHCCGCHNHPLHHKEQRNVTIEEEEPEKEKRENDSLVPSQSKNLPYPIVWFPPDYKEFEKMKNEEVGKDAPGDVKKHANGNLWNGWLPLDLRNVLSSKQRGDGEVNSRQDDEKRNLQFPLFWMPYKPDEGRENQKVENVDAKPSLESEKASGGGNRGDKSVSKVKDIPVKDVDQDVAIQSAGIQEKEGDATAKDRTPTGEKSIDNVESASPKGGPKRKSSSPPKSTKLPPVCLRVDPLPRKGSAKTKSRSPSPPGDKQKLEEKSTEAVKVCPVENGEQLKESMYKKTVPVVDGNTSPEESMNVPVETPGKLPSNSQVDVSTKQAEGKPEEGMAQKHGEPGTILKEQLADSVFVGGEKQESLGAEETKIDAAKKCSERELSEEEAAVIIQSAYRGFDVRRWAPMEKLKEIASIRERLADVKRLIQEMELSSDIKSHPQQKNIIAETIMSLLLRLDIIQGLHPSIRELRKSVVRELVSLQEQLDAIMNENSETPPGQEPAMRHDQGDAASGKSEDFMLSENSNEINPIDLQNQIDGVLNPEGPEFPVAKLIDEGASPEKTGTEAAGRSVNEDVEPAQGPAIEDEDDNITLKLENNETSVAKEDHVAIIPGPNSQVSSLQGNSAAGAGLVPTRDNDLRTGDSAELPQGLVDNICGVDGMHQSAVESDSNSGDHSKLLEGAVTILPIVQESHYGAADEENQQTMETHEETEETEETGKGGALDNCNMDYKSGKEEEVISKIEDAVFEAIESKDKQPENFIADIIEPSEASDERGFLISGACIENNTPINYEPHESSAMADSVMEELLQSQNMEEIGLISENSNSGNVDSTAAEDTSAGNDICSVEQNKADIDLSEAVSEIGEVCNSEHPESTEKQELQVEENNMVESNRKLIEENERLREMMEKLIKSGQEQLTAISSLSGRVKDLEKRLSRKKKLKLKGPRSRCVTKLDGCDAERAIGLAM